MSKCGCLLHLRLAFEAPDSDRDLQPKPSIRLSWDSSSWLCPTSDAPNRVHSRSTPRDAFLRVQTDQGPHHVPPLGFCTPATACSAARVRACCIPVPDEVRAVCTRHLPVLRRARDRRPAPHHAITPFEDFPSSAAVPHHCGRCPPAVRSSPCPKTGRCSLGPVDDLVGTCLGVSSETATVSREGVLTCCARRVAPPDAFSSLRSDRTHNGSDHRASTEPRFRRDRTPARGERLCWRPLRNHTTVQARCRDRVVARDRPQLRRVTAGDFRAFLH
jgi:hypothetical protein